MSEQIDGVVLHTKGELAEGVCLGSGYYPDGAKPLPVTKDLVSGSVWRIGNSLELVVVTEVGTGYIVKQYLDGNNGMTRTASATIENFLQWHTLFYSPEISTDGISPPVGMFTRKAQE